MNTTVPVAGTANVQLCERAPAAGALPWALHPPRALTCPPARAPPPCPADEQLSGGGFIGSVKLTNPKLNVNLGLRSNIGILDASKAISFFRLDLTLYVQYPLTPPVAGLLADGSLTAQAYAAARRAGATTLQASIDAPLPAS